jgi:tetratricopeptide (TPR) repeat protein
MRGVLSFLMLLAIGIGCATLDKDPAVDLIRDGEQLYRTGAYAQAEESYRAALKHRPNDADLLYNVARCQDRLGRLNEAEKGYRDCIAQNPNHAEARHALVELLVDTNRRKEAESMVQAWLKSNPGLAAPYIEDGWLRLLDGDLDSARGRFQQALELEPRNPRANAELARVYERIDRPDRALVLYERSLEADPNQPQLRQHLKGMLTRGISRPRPD